MKLVVAICLCVALADDSVVERVEKLELVEEMQSSLETELNGCGELCADPITISFKRFDKDGDGFITPEEFASTPFPAIQDGTCYVVDGKFARAPQPFKTITVPEGVECAKIAVAIDSTLGGIDVLGTNTEVLNEGKVDAIWGSYGDGTKITNTGTNSTDGPVTIAVYSNTTEITVSHPGKAKIFVRESAFISSVTFKCYGADVTATYLTPAVCNGSTVTATPTAAPTVAPKITNTGTYQSAASEKGGLHCSWRGCKWW